MHATSVRAGVGRTDRKRETSVITEEFDLSTRAGVDAAQDILSLAQRMRDNAKLTILASGVEAIDGVVVVAIANIAKTMQARGAPVEVREPSAAFKEAFEDLGVSEDFNRMEQV